MLDGVDGATRPAVVGVADHSGWANLVTVASDGHGPVVVDRRRCELVGQDVPRQPYHAAQGLDGAEAEALVARVTAAARSGAGATLGALVADLSDAHRAVALTMRSGAGRPLPDTVAGVLASHSAMHAAEGELYREALADAAGDLGIAVVVHPRGDVAAGAAGRLGTTSTRLAEIVGALGQAIGPPWQKEHREAATAAIVELAQHTSLDLARARNV